MLNLFLMILEKGHSCPLEVTIKQDIFHAFTILLSMFRSYCNVQSLSGLILAALFCIKSWAKITQLHLTSITSVIALV